jgi:hypothetical protein
MQHCRAWLAVSAHRYLIAILAIATVLYTMAFTWAVPRVYSPETTSPWAVDTVAPVPPLTEAYHRFTRRGTDPVVYPLFHHMVLAGAYAPYVGYQYLTGNLQNPTSEFPYGVSRPVEFFRDLTLVANTVSLLMAFGIVVSVFAITRTLFSSRAALWSAALAAFLPPMAYYAKTSNLDIPYLFWTLLAVWQYLRCHRRQNLGDYATLGVLAALAVATKDQAYGFFLPIPLLLAWTLACHAGNGIVSPQGFVRALVRPPMLVAGVAATLTFALANNLVFGGWDGFLRHLDFARTFFHEHLLAADPERLGYRAQFRLAGDSLLLLLQMFGYASLALCVGGAALAWRQRHWLSLSLLLMSVTYYATVPALAGVSVSRYLLGPALLLTPFGGAFVDYLVSHRRVVARTALATAFLCITWQIALSLHLNMTLLLDSRYRMEQWVRANIPRGSAIESQVQLRYLPAISDQYTINVVGNSYDVITYDVIPSQLTPGALATRNPAYILVMLGLGVTGDPAQVTHPTARDYFDALLCERLGYLVLARFTTPTLLPYRQVTAGTLPTSILLARRDLVDR